MRSSIFLTVLPSLAVAVDYQITQWTCTPLLDPNEGQDQLSVRDAGETGCAGYTLWEYDDNHWMGAFSGNPDLDTSFDFSEEPNVPGQFGFGATFDDHIRIGTCVDARGNDVCQTFSAACSIAILYDCSFTD